MEGSDQGPTELRAMFVNDAIRHVRRAGLAPTPGFHRALDEVVTRGIERMRSEGGVTDGDPIRVARDGLRRYAEDVVRAAAEQRQRSGDFRERGEFAVAEDVIFVVNARCKYWPFCFGVAK